MCSLSCCSVEIGEFKNGSSLMYVLMSQKINDKMSHEINGILFCLTKNVCKKLSPKIHRIPWVLTEYVGQNMIYPFLTIDEQD